VGLIRKTLSISTLGIVDFRSKKEQIRRAEKAQRAAQAELAGVEAARVATDQRLAEAEKRAHKAELLALQQAKKANEGKASRRERRKARTSQALETIEGLVASAGPAVEEQAKKLSRRSRKAAKKARKQAEVTAKKTRKQAEAAAEKASKQARKQARRAKAKVDDVTASAGELIDQHR
jgi:hypothetical protein